MIALPHMPLFVVDIETDEMCRLMGDAPFGAYIRCLIRLWIEGSLPAEPSAVSKLVGSPVDRLAKFLDAKFPVGADGRRRNPKLEEIRHDRMEKSAKNREAAGKRWGSERTSNRTCERITERTSVGIADAMPRTSDSVSDSGSSLWVGVQGKGAKPPPVPPDPLNTPAFIAAWGEWVAYRRQRRLSVLQPASVAAQWQRLAVMGHDQAIAAIQHSIANAYQGIFEPKENGHGSRNGTANGTHRPDPAAARRAERAKHEYDEPDLKPPIRR